MALVLAMALAMVLAVAQEVEGQLMVGFYGETCPQAEPIVRNVVREAILSDTNMAPVLLRLHFHDCFVEVLFSLSLLLLFFIQVILKKKESNLGSRVHE